jgi:hypothetical protein
MENLWKINHHFPINVFRRSRELGILLADLFEQLTREDINKANAVESDLKNTFPWMAEVALDSRDAVSDAIKDRFMQLVKAEKWDAEKWDAGQLIADHMFGVAIGLTKEKEIEQDKYTVFGKALINVYKWLDGGCVQNKN